MTSLLRTEWLKIKNYRAFWWLLAITVLSYPGVNFLFYEIFRQLQHKGDRMSELTKMMLGSPFSFPEVWHTVAYLSSIFLFIPAVVVIMFITNEYNFKTHRQNIIDGWSRNQFMTSKLIDILIISIIVSVLYFLIALLMGIFNTDEIGTSLFSQVYYVLLFLLQTFAQLSLAFMVGFFVRKAFISLGLFLFYFIILEPVLVMLAQFKINDIGRFLPLEISDRMIPVPAFMVNFNRESYERAIDAIPTHVVLTILVTGLAWFICYRVNNKRDL